MLKGWLCFVLSLLYVLPVYAQEVRVYRPEVTAKNYTEASSDAETTELTFILKPAFVERVYTTEENVHVLLNRKGREEIYFFTAARGKDRLHLVSEAGVLFQTYAFSSALDVTHLVSRKFDRRYPMIALAKSLRPLHSSVSENP